ncbi:MAG TPA: DUF488 domain-containing protein, partial [Phycisphaerae bacterium]
MPLPQIFTIGHSNYQPQPFLELLQKHQITAIADVRSQPHSKFAPHFNRETLEAILLRHHIKYFFIGRELGARREERECYIAGQARYDLIKNLPAFQQGLQRLHHVAATERIALMCSEKDPLTCHRTILIGRELRAQMTITHILDGGTLEPHPAAETRLLKLMG